MKKFPIRKGPGVSTDISVGSVERGVNELEFNITSIRIRRVLNSSNVSATFPKDLYKCVLRDFTTASYSSSKCEGRDGIKYHCTAVLVNSFWIYF